MYFSKVILVLVFSVFVLIDDSTQFLVANCVWDNALSGVPVDGLRGFVLSDADACVLFCSKTGVGGVVTASSATQSVASAPSAALCDRCCKSSQPPSKPGELLVSILQTLISAFGPTKTAEGQAVTASSGAGVGSGTGSGDNVGKPAPGGPPPSPSTATTTDEDDDPGFDPGNSGVTAAVVTNPKALNFVHHDFNSHDSEPSDGPSMAAPRQNRATYPEARIFEIIGMDNGRAYSDGFERATDRGPGWHHPGVDIPLKSGTIR